MRSNHHHCLQAVVLLSVIFSSSASRSQTYGQTLSRQWRNTLGLHSSDGAFRWFAYPTDNFGIITSYLAPAGRPLTDADRICATWTCLGFDPSKIPADESRYTTAAGIADSKLTASFELANDKQGRAAATLLLANLFNALAIDGPVTISEDVRFDLRAVQVFRRSLNPAKFQDYLASAPASPIRDVWRSGRLTYIAADLLARDLQLTLEVDPRTDPQLAAQISRAMAKLGRDGISSIRISSPWAGGYVVQFSGFMVLAAQLRHQPGSVLSPEDGHSAASWRHPFVASDPTIPVPHMDPATLRITPATGSLAATLSAAQHAPPQP
jgi:hypothetical protein